ncbi:hypothetical protein R5R35_011240 [Gryllus longicercus]|uniref:Accessory gland protein n=1 Tax=Gryllus longicercus TaxID=2509291 RepID=A0AAN9Z770_9ORTH
MMGNSYARELLIFLFLIILYYAEAGGKAGPYECFRVINTGPCKGFESDLISFPLKMVKDEKTDFIESDEIEVPFDLDTKVSVNITVETWDSKGWNPPTNHPFADFCKTVKSKFPEAYKDISTAIGRSATCPWVKGTYTVKKLGTCLRSSKFPIMYYGKYRVHMILIRDKKRVGCFFMEAIIDPK